MASLKLCVQTWKLLGRQFGNRLVDVEGLNKMNHLLSEIERIYEAMPAVESKKAKEKKSSGKKMQTAGDDPPTQ